MEEFKFDVCCNKEEKERYGEDKIRITNFKKVTICIGDKTKIIYRRGENLFVIEDLNKDTKDIDEYTSVVDGPEAVSTIETILKSARSRGATFFWDPRGLHCELCKPSMNPHDSRTIDYVEDEMARRDRMREEMKLEEIKQLLEINDRAVVYHDEITALYIKKNGRIHVFQKQVNEEPVDHDFIINDNGLLESCDFKMYEPINPDMLVENISELYEKDRDKAKIVFKDIIKIMMKASIKIRGES
jgi:hypothetical protein